MKPMSVREAKPQLGKLVEKVQPDSRELEALLLEAVEGPHSPYSRTEMEAVLNRVRRGQPQG